MRILAADSGYPFLNLMWTMMVFFGWIIWIWLLIMIFGDLFRRGDISGWGKAGWVVLLILLPFIGVLGYVIVQGRHMAERRQRQARTERAEVDDYIRTVANTPSNTTDQLASARLLLDSGAITDADYEAIKRKVAVS